MGTLDWLLIIDDKHAKNTMHIDRIIFGHGISCNVTLTSSKLASAEKSGIIVQKNAWHFCNFGIFWGFFLKCFSKRTRKLFCFYSIPVGYGYSTTFSLTTSQIEIMTRDHVSPSPNKLVTRSPNHQLLPSCQVSKWSGHPVHPISLENYLIVRTELSPLHPRSWDFW